MLIRDATPADLPGVRDIYNDAVRRTTAIWNEREVDLDDRRRWHAARTALGYPVLVAVDADGTVAGYTSFGDFRAFEGYRHTVEHSVYVHSNHRRQGVARRLIEALVERAGKLDKHVMVGAIAGDNDASIRLHAALGFHEVGRMPEAGTKFGRWLDLVLMQRLLDSRRDPDRLPLSGGG